MLHTILLWVAAVTFVGVFVVAIAFARGARSMPNLGDQAPRNDGPLVSVIFAARDEGANVGAALTSLLAQSYHQLEFIVVDDRSVDDTADVLRRIAGTDPRIRVLQI